QAAPIPKPQKRRFELERQFTTRQLSLRANSVDGAADYVGQVALVALQLERSRGDACDLEDRFHRSQEMIAAPLRSLQILYECWVEAFLLPTEGIDLQLQHAERCLELVGYYRQKLVPQSQRLFHLSVAQTLFLELSPFG